MRSIPPIERNTEYDIRRNFGVFECPICRALTDRVTVTVEVCWEKGSPLTTKFERDVNIQYAMCPQLNLDWHRDIALKLKGLANKPKEEDRKKLSSEIDKIREHHMMEIQNDLKLERWIGSC